MPLAGFQNKFIGFPIKYKFVLVIALHQMLGHSRIKLKIVFETR